MPLPSNVQTGTVVGRFIDSSGAIVTGSVTFTPSPTRIKNVTADPAPTTILPKSVTVALTSGSFSQVLIATDDPDNNPVDWTYEASFSLNGGFRADPFSFELPSGSTVDLTVVAPVASSDGATIIARGVPAGGTVGQVLVKASGTDYDLEWDDPSGGGGGAWGGITGTLSNQTDLNTALGLKAPLASPALTGNPTAPTQSPGNNSTRLATTAYADAADALKRNLRTARNSQTGTAYTLALADEDKIIDVFNSATHTITVPLNATVAFPTGTRIGIYRRGTGNVVISPASVDVDIEAPGGQLSLPNRYDTAWLVKRNTDIWSLEINPDVSTMATDGDITSAIGALATVATTGDYDDLIDAPALPVSLNDELVGNVTFTDTTMTATGLSVTLPVGVYDIEALLAFTGDSTDDSKFRLLFSGTGTCMLKVVGARTAWAGSSTTGLSIEEGAQKLGVQTTFDSNVGAAGSAANPAPVHWSGRVWVTAEGDLSINAAKNADANATNTVVLAGSFLSAVEVITTP